MDNSKATRLRNRRFAHEVARSVLFTEIKFNAWRQELIDGQTWVAAMRNRKLGSLQGLEEDRKWRVVDFEAAIDSRDTWQTDCRQISENLSDAVRLIGEFSAVTIFCYCCNKVAVRRVLLLLLLDERKLGYTLSCQPKNIRDQPAETCQQDISALCGKFRPRYIQLLTQGSFREILLRHFFFLQDVSYPYESRLLIVAIGSLCFAKKRFFVFTFRENWIDSYDTIYFRDSLLISLRFASFQHTEKKIN